MPLVINTQWKDKMKTWFVDACASLYDKVGDYCLADGLIHPIVREQDSVYNLKGPGEQHI